MNEEKIGLQQRGNFFHPGQKGRCLSTTRGLSVHVPVDPAKPQSDISVMQGNIRLRLLSHNCIVFFSKLVCTSLVACCPVLHLSLLHSLRCPDMQVTPQQTLYDGSSSSTLYWKKKKNRYLDTLQL